MSLRDEFLKIKTYEEYDANREKFSFEVLGWDDDIREHFCSLFPKLELERREGYVEEVRRKKPRENGSYF